MNANVKVCVCVFGVGGAVVCVLCVWCWWCCGVCVWCVCVCVCVCVCLWCCELTAVKYGARLRSFG